MSWWIVTWKNGHELRAATFPSKKGAEKLYRKLPAADKPHISNVIDTVGQRKLHDA